MFIVVLIHTYTVSFSPQDDKDLQLSDLDAWDEAERRRLELRSSQASSRSQMQAQAKEISAQYSEENRKLVLKLNLEKVRLTRH
jgi:hypothetical protein